MQHSEHNHGYNIYAVESEDEEQRGDRTAWLQIHSTRAVSSTSDKVVRIRRYVYMCSMNVLNLKKCYVNFYN